MIHELSDKNKLVPTVWGINWMLKPQHLEDNQICDDFMNASIFVVSIDGFLATQLHRTTRSLALVIFWSCIFCRLPYKDKAIPFL